MEGHTVALRTEAPSMTPIQLNIPSNNSLPYYQDTIIHCPILAKLTTPPHRNTIRPANLTMPSHRNTNKRQPTSTNHKTPPHLGSHIRCPVHDYLSRQASLSCHPAPNLLDTIAIPSPYTIQPSHASLPSHLPSNLLDTMARNSPYTVQPEPCSHQSPTTNES